METLDTSLRPGSWRQVWPMTWPLLLTGLVQNAIYLTDVAFLGRVGQSELAASALGGIWYTAFAMITQALGVGVQIVVARRMGENVPTEAGHAYNSSLVASVLFSGFSMGLMLLLAPFCFAFTISSDVLREGAFTYVYWRALELIPAAMFQANRGLWAGVGYTRPLFPLAIVQLLANMGFNYIFVFGTPVSPAMGIAGAALGSVLAQVLSTVVSYVWLSRSDARRELGLFRRLGWDGAEAMRLIRLSLPMMGQHLLSLLTFFIFIAVIEKLGEQALAAANVVKAMYILFMVVPMAFYSVANTLSSRLLGENRKDDILPALLRLSQTSCLFCLIPLGLWYLLRLPVALVFTEEQGLAALAADATFWPALAILLFAVSSPWMGSVSGLGATRMALLVELISVVSYGAYISGLYYTGQTEMKIYWTAEVVYFLGALLVSVLYLKSGRWRKLSL